MSGSHFIAQRSKFLLISTTATTYCVMERSSNTFPQTHIFLVPNIKGLAQTVLTWEGKVFAAADPDVADAAETNWKHKVTPDRGDLTMYWQVSVMIHFMLNNHYHSNTFPCLLFYHYSLILLSIFTFTRPDKCSNISTHLFCPGNLIFWCFKKAIKMVDNEILEDSGGFYWIIKPVAAVHTLEEFSRHIFIWNTYTNWIMKITVVENKEA